MRQLLAFVLKEYRHIIRDRWTTIILLALPIVMLVLFGFAISTEVKNTGFTVYDPSRDKMTRTIVDRLGANEHFRLVRELESPDEIEQVFAQAEASLVVVFGSDFQRELQHSGSASVELVADASDPNTARTIVAYASAIIGSYQQELMQNSETPYQITSNVKLLYNPAMVGAYNFVPGTLGMILMLICAMMTSVSIAREKEMGTMEVLLVSPIRPLTVVLAKVVPYFVLSVIDFTLICLMSVFVLDVPISGSLFWLIIISLTYICLALALGLLISSLVKTQLVALLISGMAMIIPVIFLSGMMFPIESMHIFFQLLSKALPASWYIAAVRKLMIMGLGFEAVEVELLVLVGMTALLTIIALNKHKARLE